MDRVYRTTEDALQGVLEWSREVRVSTIVVVSLLLRLGLVLLAHAMDSNLGLRFTDIDYYVYSDAARHVLSGGSPYDRHTYRYTPLMYFFSSYLCLLNSRVFDSGKLLFVLLDVASVLVLDRLLRRVLPPARSEWRPLLLLAFSFNPFACAISSRGSCDGVTVTLLLSFLLLLLRGQYLLSGVLYGLLVHIRIYPIVFLPLLALHIASVVAPNDDDGCTVPSWWRRRLPCAVRRYARGLLSRECLSFCVLALAVNAALLLLFWRLYGDRFVQETYLYHLTRQDNRHNFSLYFYALYLTHGAREGRLLSLLSFVPTVSLIAVLSLRFHRALFLSLFLVTLVFVTFNKVVTAQYFLWYLSLLPLLVAEVPLSMRCLWLPVAWLLAELHWLYWAYLLEMRGLNAFYGVWIAGAAFFAVNCLVLCVLIASYLEHVDASAHSKQD